MSFCDASGFCFYLQYTLDGYESRMGYFGVLAKRLGRNIPHRI